MLELSWCWELAQVKQPVFKESGLLDKWGHKKVFNEDETDFSHQDELIHNEFCPQS